MLKIQTPNGEDRVLLHSCCAPCSSAIIECLLANGIRPTVFYCNPNIYPQEEYEIRKQEAVRFVTSQNLDSSMRITIIPTGGTQCWDWKTNRNEAAVA